MTGTPAGAHHPERTASPQARLAYGVVVGLPLAALVVTQLGVPHPENGSALAIAASRGEGVVAGLVGAFAVWGVVSVVVAAALFAPVRRRGTPLSVGVFSALALAAAFAASIVPAGLVALVREDTPDTALLPGPAGSSAIAALLAVAAGLVWVIGHTPPPGSED